MTTISPPQKNNPSPDQEQQQHPPTRRKSDTTTTTSPNTPTTTTTPTDRLSTLLSSTHFTPASYLNIALPPTNTSPDSQRRMAELALTLQLQTQKCHDDIGRIGAELRAILPRCTADVSRLAAGLDGMRADAASLLKETDVGRGSSSAGGGG
eukprot:CAMPEP_0172488050 /NCGR_PEP_ID=MMETSP1066-20121228/17404_1 /TAXON_ID=671091 /ORGANISM="Coscinodiscus wailesii, Strain CCMP2513" /LENGTH=151 /DNA_ID=CAMNT_0013255031 /DNA_START=91 /DNA_END=542 /DNA_ORIENTATION=+